MDKNLQKIIDARIKETVPKILATSAFTADKVTDTPSDALQVVNRQYVTLNGPSASRPTSSIVGQFYFDTTLGIPIWWAGTKFVDATGTVA